MHRRVLALDHCYYVDTLELKCRTCNRSFRPWSPDVLKLLPAHVQAAFPATMLSNRATALDNTLLELVRGMVSRGTGFEEIANMRNDLTLQQYHKTAAVAYSMQVSARVQPSVTQPTTSPPIEPFSAFEDGDGWDGTVLSRKGLQTAFAHSQCERYMFLTLHQQRCFPGPLGIQCADHSLKWPKKLHGANDVTALYSVMYPETGKIGMHIATTSSGITEVKQALQLKENSAIRAGQPLARVHYTDNFAAEAQVLGEACELLKPKSYTNRSKR